MAHDLDLGRRQALPAAGEQQLRFALGAVDVAQQQQRDRERTPCPYELVITYNGARL